VLDEASVLTSISRAARSRELVATRAPMRFARCPWGTYVTKLVPMTLQALGPARRPAILPVSRWGAALRPGPEVRLSAACPRFRSSGWRMLGTQGETMAAWSVVVVVGEVGGQLEVPVGLGEQLGGLGL
jgi:hypothetical protein